MTDIDSRLRADAARWREHVDAPPLRSLPASSRLRLSRWVPLTAAAGVATLLAGVALVVHLLPASGIDPVTGVRPRPLPAAIGSDGVPTTFVGIYQRGSGDLGERGKLALALLSSADGHPLRDLAVTMSDSDTYLADPSRGPDGDIWYVRRSRSCGGRIIRIDAATGRGTVVLSRPGVNVASPVASPDDHWLAYRVNSCDPRSGANELVLRILATGEEQSILPVDATGRPGAVPTPTLVTKGSGGKIAGGAVRVPDVPAFVSAPAWNSDSSRVVIAHAVLGRSVGLGLAVLDAATGRQMARIAAPRRCEYRSVVYDAAGLALGETCDATATQPRSAIVQVGPDLRSMLRRQPLPDCSDSPKVSAAGDRREALLVTSYLFCLGTGTRHPLQRVVILQAGRLRTVHDYVAPAEFLDGATW